VNTAALIERFGLLLKPNFFDEQTCDRIIADARRGTSAPASVYGRGDSSAIDERVRKASRLRPSIDTDAFVRFRLLEFKPSVEEHFTLNLKDIEEPQYLRYGVGDFFVAHQDGNTGLIQLETDSERKISIVLFLNQQTDIPKPRSYSGGSLKFSDYRADPGYRELSFLHKRECWSRSDPRSLMKFYRSQKASVSRS